MRMANLKKDKLTKDTPGLTRRKFLYNISRSSYEKDWGTQYQRPGVDRATLETLARTTGGAVFDLDQDLDVDGRGEL